MLLWILALAALLYAALEWPQVSLILKGYGCFLLMLAVLVLLAVGFAVFWLVDEGLKRVQDFVCSQVEVLE